MLWKVGIKQGNCSMLTPYQHLMNSFVSSDGTSPLGLEVPTLWEHQTPAAFWISTVKGGTLSSCWEPESHEEQRDPCTLQWPAPRPAVPLIATLSLSRERQLLTHSDILLQNWEEIISDILHITISPHHETVIHWKAKQKYINWSFNILTKSNWKKVAAMQQQQRSNHQKKNLKHIRNSNSLL